MEERTLEELNGEYKNLVEKVKQIKIELEKAIATKETADGNYELASADFTAKKATYDALEAGLAQVEKSGFSEALVNQMKQEIENAKKQMEDAELTLKTREQEQKQAKEAFEKIEGESKKESSRLDVILVSFGANETINKAISNEIEIDYTEMVEAKKAERAQVEELKTQISEDSKVQEKVQELDDLLKRFEELKKNVTPENAAQLAGIGKAIKSQRSSIVNRIRALGVKGGKITAEEVDRMVGERDEQGRFVIAELDRRTAIADKEIADIQEEKKSLLEKLAISLEIGRKSEQENAEYQQLKAEIEGLTAEKGTLEQQLEATRQALSDIETRRQELRTELENLPEVDSVEIKKLQADRAAIEAETVEEIDNPEKEKLRKQIEELEARKEAGKAAGAESEEYKAAKAEYDAAVKKLQAEQTRPTVFFVPRTDEVIDNPEVVNLRSELSSKEKDLNAFGNTLMSKNPELKQLNSDYLALKEEEETVLSEYMQIQSETKKKGDKLFMEYVSDEMYPELTDENSDQYKAFDAYKQAELELRKAMIALQKDPSDENLAALNAARQNLSETTSALQNSLAIAAGTYSYASPKALHSYLLGKLKDAYDEYEPIDEAYDINNVERRIAILGSRVGKDDKVAVDALRDSRDALDGMLEDMLNGSEIDEDALFDMISTHQANIAAFDDSEQAKSILKGTDIDTSNARFGFLRRIISSFRTPKVEEKYYFPANKAPASKAEYEEVYGRSEEVKARLEKVKQDKANAKAAFDKKLEEVTTPDEKDKLRSIQREVTAIRTKLSGLPERINKTKLAALENEVRVAEEKMKNTPQHNAAVDVKAIDAEIAGLTAKLDAEPDKIEDPEKAASKKRRLSEKDALIEEARMDVEDPRRSEIESLLAKLAENEVAEKTKLDETTGRLNTIIAKLKEKGGLLAMLEVAKQKIMSLIHIKDANRMLDRRSGRIAEDLVNATRPKREEQEER